MGGASFVSVVALVAACGVGALEMVENRVVQLSPAEFKVPGGNVPAMVGAQPKEMGDSPVQNNFFKMDGTATSNAMIEEQKMQKAEHDAKMEEEMVQAAGDTDVTSADEPFDDKEPEPKEKQVTFGTEDAEAQILYNDAEKMTNEIDQPKEENPEYKTNNETTWHTQFPNGEDDTDITSMTTEHTAAEKEKMLKDALNTWDNAWSITTGNNYTSEGGSEDDHKDHMAEIAKAKAAFQRVMMEHHKRMDEEYEVAKGRLNKIDQESEEKIAQRTSAAKAAFIAAKSADRVAEVRVEHEEKLDLARASKAAEEHLQAVAYQVRKQKKATESAAKAVERERQHSIAAQEAAANKVNSKPAKISIDDKVDVDEETGLDAKEAAANLPAVALSPPISVVRAIKEIAQKNGIVANFESAEAGSGEEAKKDAGEQYNEQQNKYREKLSELSVKSAVKTASVWDEQKAAMQPKAPGAGR